MKVPISFICILVFCVVVISLDKNYVVASEERFDTAIFESFVERFVRCDDTGAFALFHPKLQNLWGADSFKGDLKDFRTYTMKDQFPILSSSYHGESPQGKYVRIGYQFGYGTGKKTIMELTAMESNKEQYITKLDVRLPYAELPPKSVVDAIKNFEAAMMAERYDEVSKLMTDSCASRFTNKVLKQIRPIISEIDIELERSFYRFCVNSFWYDAATIHPKGSDFTFVEVFLKSENSESKITSISFRGKITNR